MFNFGSYSELHSFNLLQVSFGANQQCCESDQKKCANLLLSFVRSYDVVQIIMTAGFTAAFLYPHIGFILEVKKGIMTRDTYPREEFSCCCVTARA